MTEQEFHQRIEGAVDRLEQRIENSTARLEKNVARAYSSNPAFRWTAEGVSLAMEIGLILGSGQLERQGRHIAALCCFSLGTVSLVVHIVTALAIRRQ